ncbi:hypothetical protein M6D93_11330 [Jatrophihabitans telluris]|uniref:MarR family transcriptional regulator n=1 Tax=Jatrophihabitans telluris TaxID=2038343 RepID=A0ABY4QUH3_9ACTN|nr:hypothetical protein [Jatrophihabitans telluris]UQX86897.1 hypothetical protein M6D93_11330 [Jatrophihabitans telluris]
MPRLLSDEILTLLRARRAEQGPVSLASLSRSFGVSTRLVSSCAAEMVGRGLAEPAMVTEHGVSKMHGLMPQHVTEPAS